MTVAELIVALKRLPPELLVLERTATNPDRWDPMDGWSPRRIVVREHKGLHGSPYYREFRSRDEGSETPIEAVEL